MNLYGFVGNDGVNSFDLFGLWLGNTHKRLTYESFNWASKPSEMYDGKLWEGILKILENANVEVDKGDTANIMAWHFNRGLNEAVLTAKNNYTNLLSEQKELFDENIEPKEELSCREALKILGGLSHVWQDYYAHAIEKEQYVKPWAVLLPFGGIFERYGRIEPGYISGDPDNIGSKIKPSSFGWMPSLRSLSLGNTGEHGLGEPGNRAPDREERLNQARVFVTIKFGSYLKDWWEACNCYKNEFKRKDK